MPELDKNSPQSQLANSNGGKAQVFLSLKEMALISRLRKIKFGEVRVHIVNFGIVKINSDISEPLHDSEGIEFLKQEQRMYEFKKGKVDNIDI